jgi:hypothetical protein
MTLCVQFDDDLALATEPAGIIVFGVWGICSDTRHSVIPVGGTADNGLRVSDCHSGPNLIAGGLVDSDNRQTK